MAVNEGGNDMITDKDLHRDTMGHLRPYSEVIYDRKKVKKAMLQPSETAECTVCCTCPGPHESLRVVMGKHGIPKEVVGNDLCWYNQFFFIKIEKINKFKVLIFTSGNNRR